MKKYLIWLAIPSFVLLTSLWLYDYYLETPEILMMENQENVMIIDTIDTEQINIVEIIDTINYSIPKPVTLMSRIYSKSSKNDTSTKFETYHLNIPKDTFRIEKRYVIDTVKVSIIDTIKIQNPVQLNNDKFEMYNFVVSEVKELLTYILGLLNGIFGLVFLIKKIQGKLK
jgi:hypothetical protein